MVRYDDKPWLKWYDKGVDPSLNVPECTYIDLLDEAIRKFPSRTAFHFLGSDFTYRELDLLSRSFASFLKSRKVAPGDAIGICLPNTPQYLIALVGALRYGCVVSGVSPLLAPKEMENQINDAGIRVLVILDLLYQERLKKIKGETPGLKHVIATNIADFLPGYKRVLGKLLKKIPSGRIEPIAGKEVLDFRLMLSDNRPIDPKPSIAPGDVCFIQYTGGTTGLPKGAMLTHRNIVSNILQAKNWFGFEMGGGTACSGFPYFHQAGLYFGLTTLSLAYTQCLIPDPRNTSHMCGEIKKYRPEVMLHVPSLYQMLMNNPLFGTIDFSFNKVCISGASPFSKEGIEALESYVGKGKLVEIFGMTEASPLISMNPFKGKKKIGSVGVPLQDTMVRVVDIESGTKDVPIGEPGEIIVQGPQVMKGYHNKPDETANTLRKLNGGTWLYTGDIARMDEEGFIYLVDRSKDMLNVGGFKVFSREVEDTLYRYADIESCAIIGIPDPKRPDSEIVKAVIQLTKDAKAKKPEDVRGAIAEYCKENLAPYKNPKQIEFVDAMPLTSVGKVDKKALKKSPVQ